MEKIELLDFFEGKQNVIHVVTDDGRDSYLSQSIDFVEELIMLNACSLNTVEHDNKHVLFLFDKDGVEVKRYYIGKMVQGNTPQWFVKNKDRLIVFESYNPDSGRWVPCVGFRTSPKFQQPNAIITF